MLTKLRTAGGSNQAIPGGGAEIFHPEVRSRISHDKATGDEYLQVHRVAHRMGMRTNSTMLYGHIETFDHRVDHLMRLRALQDETGGMQAFIPLAFHPDGNGMKHLPAPTAIDDLRTIAVSRLVLDNIPHIKAYWVNLTPDVAQIALRFQGLDDIDRHDRPRDDLPRGRDAIAERARVRRSRSLDSRSGAHADRARHPLQTSFSRSTRRARRRRPR